MNILKRHNSLQKAFKYLLSQGIVSTQKDVAKKMHATPPNVSKALAGDEKALTESFMRRFNIAFGGIFRDAWLLEGEGNMLTSPNERKVITFEYNEKENMFHENLGDSIENTNGYRTICKTTYQIWDPFRDKLRIIQNNGTNLSFNQIVELWNEYILSYTNGSKNEPSETQSNDDHDELTLSEQSGDNSYESVPLLPVEAMAGGLTGISEGVILRDCRKIKSPVNGAEWVIQISGDSMIPELISGTFLYIKRINNKAFIPWGNTLVVDTENGVVVKKLFPVSNTDEYVEARSVNPDYPPYKIETSSIYGIYRILATSFVNSTI